MSEKITTEQMEFALVSMDKAIEHAYEYRRKNPSWDEEEADFDLKSDNAALATIRARLLRLDELEQEKVELKSKLGSALADANKTKRRLLYVEAELESTKKRLIDERNGRYARSGGETQ